MKRLSTALCLALAPLSAFAQTRIGSTVEVPAGRGTGPAGLNTGVSLLPLGTVLPTGSISLTVSPILGAPTPTALANPVKAIEAVSAVIPVAKAVLPVQAVPATAKIIDIAQPVIQTAPLALAERTSYHRVQALVTEQTIDWSAASTPDAPPDVPTPLTPNKSRPGLAKAALISGAAMIGSAVAAAAVPALIPAAIVTWKGALAWTGFAALAASRFWRTPGNAPDVPRGPPAPADGSFSSFKAAWAAARDSAAAQKSFEENVGNSSWSSFRNWFLGGMRTGLYWMAPSLLLMLGGAIVSKIAMFFTFKSVAALPGVSDASIAMMPLAQFFGGIVPMALATEAVGVATFFGVEWLAKKLGFAKAAPWLGGAAALGYSLAGLLALTHAPFVIAVSLALEAGVIWTAYKSRSFIAPIALRGILTVFSLEAARLGAWLKFGVAGSLVGLPAVWGGVVVGVIALIAWKLKSPGLKMAEIGAAWNAPEPGQKPKSPARILSAGLIWGLVVYAVGDLVYWGVNWLVPGHEPAPAILAKMLTSGVDLVLYNFILVGLLEEYIFRRGLFKMMNDKLDKWGVPLKRAFWLAAIGSALIFSGVHYIDWGAIMAKFGMGDATASSGLGGAYDFTLAGFMARSALGVLLAWMYKRSGLIMIPIVAHFWADSMEGLGLRWGFPAFIALAAGAALLSFVFRPKDPKPKSS